MMPAWAVTTVTHLWICRFSWHRDIDRIAKLPLLLVSFFPNIHTKSSLPQFKLVISCFTHRGHNESFIQFVFVAAFNKFESCCSVFFSLFFMVNRPSISVYHMECSLNIPTMSNLKYFIAGEGIQTVSLTMQREKTPSDVAQEALCSSLFLSNLCS